MKFRTLVKVYLLALLISVAIFFLLSSSQGKGDNWEDNYSKQYLESMSDADFKKFVDSHRNISGMGYIEVPGRKLGRQISNPLNTKTSPSIKSVRKLIVVLAVIGVFIIVYYIISRLINFLRKYIHKKKPPEISNSDDRQFKENQNPEKRYLSILGLKGTVSESEIKRIYRELMSRYHPDKVQHLGREFQQMAEEKTKEIQEAYDYVKQKYNINN
jgi:hypothetical protein